MQQVITGRKTISLLSFISIGVFNDLKKNLVINIVTLQFTQSLEQIFF